MPQLNVLDIFCGAGGFSEGFREAGYNIVCGIDNNSAALSTFAHNFPNAKCLHKDLSKKLINDKDFLSAISGREIQVIIGGPPCQGFSIAGKRLRNDPRNKLYIAYMDLIQHLKPAAIAVENVPTILSLFNGKVARQIIEDFESIGYKVYNFTLLASDFGVPQNRKRTFFIALDKKIQNSYVIPSAIAGPKITTEEAISDLPLLDRDLGADAQEFTSKSLSGYQRLMRRGAHKLYNHWAVQHKPETISIIKLVPDGGNYRDLPRHLQSTRKVNIAWTRMNSRRPCFTIDAGHNHHFHYKANRVPTVRECARIQSFPDRFLFLGNKTSQYRQVGNAVPPLLGKVIAESVTKALAQ